MSEPVIDPFRHVERSAYATGIKYYLENMPDLMLTFHTEVHFSNDKGKGKYTFGEKDGMLVSPALLAIQYEEVAPSFGKYLVINVRKLACPDLSVNVEDFTISGSVMVNGVACSFCIPIHLLRTIIYGQHQREFTQVGYLSELVLMGHEQNKPTKPTKPFLSVVN
jgi:hypothetical protein